MLWSLITYIKMLTSDTKFKKRTCFIISILSEILAIESKEIAVLLPFLIFMVHISFYRNYKKAAVNCLIFLIITLIVPISIYLKAPGTLGELGIIRDTTPVETTVLNTTSPKYYLFTQFRVIVTYIRLLLLPINQKLIYNYHFYTSFFNVHVFSSFLFLLSVILFGIYIYFLSYKEGKQIFRLSSLGIYWFFVFLSLTSTFIPFNDLIAEHWIYFSSIGFMLFVVTIITTIAEKNGKFAAKAVLTGLILLIITLSMVSYKRNSVWQSEISLWKDVISKNPESAKGHFTLGLSYLNHGDYDYAIEEFENTIKLNTKSKALFQTLEQFYLYLGISYRKKASYEKAVEVFKKVISLSNSSSSNNRDTLIDAYNELGCTYLDMNNYDMALEQFTKAMKLNNNIKKTHVNLGNLFIKTNNIDKAISEFLFVASNNPDDLQVHFILGLLFKENKLYDKAIMEFIKNIELNRNHIESYIEIASVYIILKQNQLARPYVLKALSINPSNSEAQYLMRQLN
ncbi:MAG: tetratricopeptide repeat protein [Nitrospirae bacterium]|nr:tetratricopeptide repeat protein [Nitrospirota bacterium]